MGVFKPFSSDSRDCEKVRVETQYIPIENTSTPDPTNFRVLRKKIVNGFPIYMVRYPGVKNYEGLKILMYPKHFNTETIKNRMDPHFFTKGDSPIARFEPTEYGWSLAITLAKSL